EVVAQLADRFDAVVAEQRRRIVSAAEEAAAVAALLRDQQRIEGILAVDRAERRHRAEQHLAAAELRLDLLEVDAADGVQQELRIEADREIGGAVVLRATEPLDALAVGHVDLVDAEEAVGPVGIRLEAEAAQMIPVDRLLEGVEVGEVVA